MKKTRVGILGATGMVGQRFVMLLANHPWFDITIVAASPRSAGKQYGHVMHDRWTMEEAIPEHVQSLVIHSVSDDVAVIAANVDLVFSALDLDKQEIQDIENSYAAAGIFVVSNNSAHRWTDDVPMILPEVNPEHLALVDIQRKNRGWTTGGIIVKSNCSIQSYVPMLKAWEEFVPTKVLVTTAQAISGAGKTFETWPEMVDNVIPYIGGEEEKSEKEPLKVFGSISGNKLIPATTPAISATCLRVAVADGHMASLAVQFEKDVTEELLIVALQQYQNPIADLDLPSAPKEFIHYFPESDRPQTHTDRALGNGMTISVGRIRKDVVLGFKCIGLSHNTIRGAAGGAVLAAELVVKKGYISSV